MREWTGGYDGANERMGMREWESKARRTGCTCRRTCARMRMGANARLRIRARGVEDLALCVIRGLLASVDINTIFSIYVCAIYNQINSNQSELPQEGCEELSI